jgi:hypothetical protein
MEPVVLAAQIMGRVFRWQEFLFIKYICFLKIPTETSNI